MDSFSVACCVYCYMGYEEKFAEQVSGVKVIVPYKIRREREKGRWVDKKIKLIPGYAFVYADNIQEIIDSTREFKVRLLSYPDKTYALHGADLEVARWVWNNLGVIGVSYAVHEKDKVKIVSGALKENEGIITRLDRRHRLALVELKIGMRMWLSYDWLDNKAS